jgi:hypothetical protein
MTITVESILEQARKLSPNDRVRLRDALDEETPFEYPPISPEVLKMLEGKTVDDFIVKPTKSPDELRKMLREWRTSDEAADDEGGVTWDEMLQSLDRNRFSMRRLFTEDVDDAE